ncbi:DUF4139 domain-containing protein, partial [bacterium]|nr:DUF4139 domain-containing protein [bacterium]
LDESIEAVGDRIAQNKTAQVLVKQRTAYLSSLEAFTAPTAKTEMTKGVLDVGGLKQIALFTFEQRTTAAEETLKLTIADRTLAKQLSLLKRQRAELTAGASRTEREALMFLEKRGAAPTTLTLSYLVRRATWSPSYNFRAVGGAEKTEVEYNAIVQQMSGENWDGVTLTLSTASPTLAAQGPGLAPFRVALGKGKALVAQKSAGKLRFVQKRLQQAEQQQRAAQVMTDNRAFNWEMNAAANDWQGLELTVDNDALSSIAEKPAAGGDVTSVSYRLEGGVSLASRSDQQMLRIVAMALPCTFYHLATPVLTSHVYREAQLTNTGSDALLTGSASVYLDGRFVGRGLIPTVARGETFVMGFGADPQVRARRELIDKAVAVQGGNREIVLTYRLVLENFKDSEVAVRLIDRTPVPRRKADLRVTLGELKTPLSTDALYKRLEEPKGILRWDLKLAAKAAGEKPTLIEYTTKLEFERSFQLASPAGVKDKEAQDEFDQMQFDRYGF